MIFKTKMPLTVLNCHTILIENVYWLLCKSMLSAMFIKLSVKLKHIHLASYVGVEKLAAKVNAALLWKTNIMSKISLKLCTFSLWNSLNLDWGKTCEPCNSLLAKASESQGAWVQKSQGTLLKIGWKPWFTLRRFLRILVSPFWPVLKNLLKF